MNTKKSTLPFDSRNTSGDVAPGQLGHVGQVVVVGKIVGLFGREGKVKLVSYMEPHEGICELSCCVLGQERRHFKLVGVRAHGVGFVAQLTGIENRGAAACLLGEEIAIDEHSLGAIGEGEYYWHQLSGMRVVTRDGVELGEVRGLFRTGASDIMEVCRDGMPTLVPFVWSRYVLDVDEACNCITVDWQRDW